MYDVYYKRNNQKKIILIIVGIIAVVIVGVIAFMLLSGDDSKKVLEDYYAKVEQGKYKQLFEMLDDESKKNYSQDEFIERNKTIIPRYFSITYYCFIIKLCFPCKSIHIYMIF